MRGELCRELIIMIIMICKSKIELDFTESALLLYNAFVVLKKTEDLRVPQVN